MENKIATCPFCGDSQTIVMPTVGKYRCRGCGANVPQEQYQLEDPPRRNAIGQNKAKQKANSEYAAALIELSAALNEWKDAGADVLTVVSAMQRLVFAINDKERIASS